MDALSDHELETLRFIKERAVTRLQKDGVEVEDLDVFMNVELLRILFENFPHSYLS